MKTTDLIADPTHPLGIAYRAMREAGAGEGSRTGLESLLGLPCARWRVKDGYFWVCWSPSLGDKVQAIPPSIYPFEIADPATVGDIWRQATGGKP